MMKKEDFIFSVGECTLAYNPTVKFPESFTSDSIPKNLVRDYKGIVNLDNERLISVVSKTYQLRSNEEVLKNTLNVLEELGIDYFIEPMHSLVSDRRMICHAVFKDSAINDGNSPVNLSMLIHNSYDMTTAFRFRFGTFRSICSNGALIGHKNLMEAVYRRHTQHFVIEDIKDSIITAVKVFPTILDRINLLQAQEFQFIPAVKDNLTKLMGNKFINEMYEKFMWEKIKNYYDLYNILTQYISHNISVTLREAYLQKVAKLFSL